MKKYFLFSLNLVFLIFVYNSAFAQNKADDIGRLKLAPVILPQASNIPLEASSLLIDKLNQLVSDNGMSADVYNTRFIITPNISIVSKEILGGAPILYSIKIKVSIYIGDAITGAKFSSTNIESIGTGTSENKAFIQAFNKIKPDDSRIVKVLAEGKDKIINYYTVNCDILLKQATSLALNRNYDQAIFNLISIPDACGVCYNKAIDAITPIFKNKIDYECELNLNLANNVWNSNQSYTGAEEAGKYLSKIDPSASCYGQAKVLRDNIKSRILDINNREWNYKWESEIGITKDLIKAYRDIGVAYGENQPETITTTTTYNILWW